MKKLARNLWFLLSFLILLTSLTFPFIYWRFIPTKKINVVVLDKTVPVKTYREHKGLIWMLNNLKYTHISGKRFNISKDYYGFFPLNERDYDIKELPEKISNPDLIYIADTYGVYTDDFYSENLRGNRSELMYGGLQPDEIKKIKDSLNRKNLLIAEFNSFATPTDKTARKELEKLLGVEWSGWIGRYFSNLSQSNTELPLWLIKNYENQYGKKWKFKDEGFAFVKENDRIFILDESMVNDDLLSIDFDNNFAKKYGVLDDAKYHYWFDIVKPEKKDEVIANFKLDVNIKGKRELHKFGLSKNFPAIVRRTRPFQTYYFAGDFADKDNLPDYWNIAFLKILYSNIREDIKGEQDFFFWNVYYPLLENILSKDLKR